MNKPKALAILASSVILMSGIIYYLYHNVGTNNKSTSDSVTVVGDTTERLSKSASVQYESFILYSKAGQDLQIKNTPYVQNPEKNWYQIRGDYATQNRNTHLSQLDTIRDVLNDGYSFVKTGKPTYQEIKNEYLWVYSTPTTPPTIPFGIYMTADTLKYKMNVNVLIDSLTNIYTKKCTQWGFFISKNTSRTADPNHYQSVQTQKL